MSDYRPSIRVVRRALNPIAALAVVLLVAGCVTGQDDGSTAPGGNPPATGAAPGGPVPLAGVLTGSPAPAVTKPHGAGAGAIETATAPIGLRYTFDGGLGRSISDADGQFPLRAISQNDGTLTFTPRDGGLALLFPPRCTLDEAICPRAILEGVRLDAINPGTRPLQYGASVLMTHDDLADGANVMQKGYSVGGGTQFKLQVDHLQGHPSCVIASQQKIYKAEPKVDIADGAWHALSCSRSGSRLTMSVDGIDSDSVFVPPALSIANAEPLRVGGKGANKGNDQFAGQLDDIHLTIG